LHFISESQAKGTTPRGLRINIRCHAFLKRESNVEQEFKETTRCAEADYVDNLKQHYTKVAEKLIEDEKTLEEKMDETRKRADRVEEEEHRTMMVKTKENIGSYIQPKNSNDYKVEEDDSNPTVVGEISEETRGDTETVEGTKDTETVGGTEDTETVGVAEAEAEGSDVVTTQSG
jgi:hypothetical protein